MHDITVCAGTTCVVMDGGDLLLLDERLPEDLRGQVRVRAVPCLEACSRHRCGDAPHVLVDGQPLQRATLDRIVAALRGEPNRE